MVKTDSLTPVQTELAEQFASINGVVEPSGMKLVFDLLNEGEIEFACVGTENEHLHATHPADQHAQWCATCHALQLGEKNAN